VLQTVTFLIVSRHGCVYMDGYVRVHVCIFEGKYLGN